MNLLKALTMMSGMTLVSRVFGFIRDMVIARIFGAGFAMDAFAVAFILPNLLRRIFAEGAFSQAFVPVLMEYKQLKDSKSTRLFLAKISGLLSFVLIIASAIGIVAAPWIMLVSAPGFENEPEKFDLAIQLLRITFPYILFVSLSSLASSILNTWNQFAIPAFAPTLLNISFIICALFLAPYCHPPILALSIAVFVGGLLQLLLQLPYVKNIGMLVVPNFHFKDSAVWRVVRQMGPAIFGISVAQLSLVINTIFASFLVSGSISWIYYADRLMGLPVGLLAASLSTILLPLLSQHVVNRNQKHFSRLLDWAIRLSLVLSLPASVGLAILSMPIIQTLFMYDQFTYYDAQMTQQALIAYSIGIVGIMLVKVFAPSFYAIKDMKTPVKVAILSIVLTQLMNGLFIWHLRHAGLALSIALGATFNAIMLWIFLRKHQLYQPNPGWAVFLSQLAFAVGMMAAVLVLLPVYLPCQWDGTLWQRAGWLMVLISAGGITYFAALYAIGLRLHHLTHRIE